MNEGDLLPRAEYVSASVLCFIIVASAVLPSIGYSDLLLTAVTSTVSASTTTLTSQTGLNQTQEPCTVMHPDPTTLREWIRQYNASALAAVQPGTVTPTGGTSFNLLSHLQYTASERDQGDAGNCWVWAGTGVLEIALDIQRGIKDRLSIQYFDSSYNGGTTTTWGKWAGCGGWLTDFATFYNTQKMVIPWSNTNAYYQDSLRSCESGGTSVSASSISTSPNYPIVTCVANTIPTQGVGQSAAIANIKNILQNKAVWFTFFLADSSDWYNFKTTFWKNKGEGASWSPDFSNGHIYNHNPNEGGGHSVLCVGWDDTDPNNSYWIMVNSWGNASGGRPNGIFHLSMSINYDCKLPGLAGQNDDYSLYWQTLDVSFPAQYNVHLESREDDAASSNKGTINSYSLPTTILKTAGSYSATYSPEAGYWFVRWETSGGVSVSSATSQSTTVTVSSSGTLRAIYANPFSPLTVALISPSSGAVVSSSPVELKVRVTSGGSAVQDTTVMFYVDGSVLPTSSTSDSNGYATRAYLPPSAKSYSWYATAEKYQYDRGTSPTWTFTFSPDLRGTLQHFDLDYRGVPPSSDGDDQISITVNAGSTLTLFFYYKEGSAGNPYIIRVYLEWDKSRVIARSNNGGTDPETGWEVGGFRWGKGDYTVPSTGGTYKARVVYTGSQTPPTWDSYDRLLAEGTITVLPVTTITIASTPSGSGFVKVDGATITTPWTFTWTVGSTHTLEALSPVTGGSGIQYIWVSWSDGAAQSHSYSVPSSSQTVAANYKTQYYLTLQVNPTAGGTVSPSSRWCDAGSVIPIQATASSGYLFSSWLGSGTGSYTGSLNPTTVSMNGPITETANFARAGALQYFDLDYRGTPPSSDGNDQQSVSVGAGSTLTLFFYYREGDAGNYYIIRVFPEWNKGLVIAKSDNHGTVIEDTGREIGGFRWDYGSYTVPSAPRTYRVRVVYRASQTPPTWDSYDRLLAEGTVTVLPIVTVATTTTETTSATLTSSTTASVTTSSLSTTTTTMASSSTSYQTTTSTRYSGSTSTSYTTRTTLLSTSTTLSTTILTSAGTSTLATTELSKTGTTTVSESLTSITTSGDTLYVNIKVRQTVIEQFLKKIMSTIVQWFSELSRIVQNLFVTETVRETVVRIEPLSAERGTCRIVLDASPKPGYVGKPVRIIGVMYGSWRCIRDGMVVGKPVEITAGWGFRAVVVTNDRGEFSIDTTAPSTVYSPPVPYLITAAFYEDQDLTGTSTTITYQIIAKTPTTITISYVGNREFAGYLRRTDTGEYLAYKPVKLTVTYLLGGSWQTTTYNLQTRQDGYWTLEFLFYWSSATITFEGDETYASSTATITRSGSGPPGGRSASPPRASSAATEASCRLTLDASPKPGYINKPANISGIMYGSWRCIRDGMVVGKPVEVMTGWGFSKVLTTDYCGRFSVITNCPSQGGTYPITATFYEDQDLTASSTTISYEVVAKIPTTITISYVGNREFGGYLRRADTGAYLAYKPVKLTVTYLSGTTWRTDSFDLQTRQDGYWSLEFLLYWNQATIAFEGDETYAPSQATITR